MLLLLGLLGGKVPLDRDQQPCPQRSVTTSSSSAAGARTTPPSLLQGRRCCFSPLPASTCSASSTGVWGYTKTTRPELAYTVCSPLGKDGQCHELAGSNNNSASETVSQIVESSGFGEISGATPHDPSLFFPIYLCTFYNLVLPRLHNYTHSLIHMHQHSPSRWVINIYHPHLATG